MPSPIHVTRKTINGRDVISIRKEYNGDEHEVMCPVEDGIQLLFNIMSVVNDDRAESDEFVLVRKSDVGRLEDTGVVADESQTRKDTLAQVTSALFDDQTTADVMLAVENESQATPDGGQYE